MKRGIVPILEADKGYDAMSVRISVLALNIFPFIAYRKMSKAKQRPRRMYLEKNRWKVERAIAWMQRKFRRLVVRWERKTEFWEGFLILGLVKFWIDRLSG